MKRDVRTFWAVTTMSAGGKADTGKYRSRHSTAAGVRAEFLKHNNNVIKVARWK